MYLTLVQEERKLQSDVGTLVQLHLTNTNVECVENLHTGDKDE